MCWKPCLILKKLKWLNFNNLFNPSYFHFKHVINFKIINEIFNIFFIINLSLEYILKKKTIHTSNALRPHVASGYHTGRCRYNGMIATKHSQLVSPSICLHRTLSAWNALIYSLHLSLGWRDVGTFSSSF